MATIDDFKKLDIRIGKVVSAEKVEGADKLLKLIFDFGSDPSTGSQPSQSFSGQAGRDTRQILAGIAQFYEPEALIGKEMPVIVNLEPRTLRGYESQGMILCADAEGRPAILMPETEVPAGSIVK
ncbi:MAG: methionine--tRNA ligase [Candidatus Liptonbacteria bacterium]|nr:methionine--tRNA ligase [Candidatus Liptonbacteria bacterium]